MKTIPVTTPTQSQKDRFWSKVNRKSDDECWNFLAYTVPCGYGAFGINERVVPAHRVAWTIVNGPIPPDVMVLHRCDNPPCCNPRHLFLGDQTANMVDMQEKGRSTFGERHAKAKLTEKQVAWIRKLNLEKRRGCGYRALAKRFGVDRTTIRLIVKGVNWSYLK